MKIEALLDCARDSAAVVHLCARLGGRPGDYPLEDDDPAGSRHWVFHAAGLQLLFDARDRVSTVFLLGAHDPPYRPWSLGLPHGLDWGQSREAVFDLLGRPDAEVVPAWARWDHPAYSLHAEWSADTTLARLTLMRPDVVPPPPEPSR